MHAHRSRSCQTSIVVMALSLLIARPSPGQCGEWQPLGNGIASRVNALTTYQGDLISGNELSPELRRWDGSAWQTLSGVLDDSVHSLITFEGDLIVGGWFNGTANSPNTLNRIARWTGSAWEPMGNGFANGPVDAMAIYNGNLIAGGGLPAGQGFRFGARWTGSTWTLLGGGVNDSITSMVVHDGDLIVGGVFNVAGSGANAISVSNIARWDGSAWHAMGAGFSAGGVHALAIYQGELIAGGAFESSGGQQLNHIARWDGAGDWQPLGSGIDGSGFQIVSALAVYNGRLIAAGTMNSAGGTPVNNIARWDGSTWQPLGGGMNDWLASLTVFGDQLIAGGNFDVAGDGPATHIARWIDCPCPADISPDGHVDVDDLVMVILSWGVCPDPENCPADIDQSGAVDTDDLVAVILAWGVCQ